MVSLRCKLLVHNELDSLGIPHLVAELGSVQLTQDISKEKENELKAVLQKTGLN